jgi:hypothetical protein
MKIFNKKIILVGPGTLPIPVTGTNGWGGIENTLTRIIQEFDKRHQNYVLINDQNNYSTLVRQHINDDNAVVHVHYDDYIQNLQKLNCPLIATSHSPFHPHRQTWNGGVFNHFYNLFSSINGYFGQSEVSNQNAIILNSKLKTGLCRVGIPEEMYTPYRKEKGNKKSLIIGKIEPRKMQAELQLYFGNLHIDFVGPLADSRFKPYKVGNTNYLGVWSRKEVQEKMTDYSSLILMSHFEGDAGVVKEALASGCSLILTPEASLNIDDKSFIKKINLSDLSKFTSIVHQVNEENDLYRNLIFQYFKEKFDIKVTTDEYINDLNLHYA